MKLSARVLIYPFLLFTVSLLLTQPIFAAVAQKSGDQHYTRLISRISRIEGIVQARERGAATGSHEAHFEAAGLNSELAELTKAASALEIRQRAVFMERIGRLEARINRLAERIQRSEHRKATEKRATGKTSLLLAAERTPEPEADRQQGIAAHQAVIKQYEQRKAALIAQQKRNRHVTGSGSISGNITDAVTNEAISYVTVEVYDEAGNWVSLGSADSNGWYSVTGLSTGSYFLTTITWTLYVPEVYDNIVCEPPHLCDPLLGTPVQVVDGQNTQHIDFALDRGGQITGTFTDEPTGATLGNTTIDVYNAEGEWVSFGMSAPDGTYVLREDYPLSSGNYYAIGAMWPADHIHFAELYNNVECPWGDCDPTTGTAIPIAVNTTMTNIDFSLPRGGTIAGNITDTSGTPISDARLKVYDSTGAAAGRGAIDVPGHYVAGPFESGNYYILTQFADSPFINELYNNIVCHPVGACDPATGTLVPVTVHNETSGIDFALVRGGSISGSVADAVTGEPLIGATVTAYSESGDAVSSASTNAKGAYLVQGLLSGNYFVVTSTEGYVNEAYDNMVCQPPYPCDPTTATPVPVSLGANSPGINFLLDTFASIAGTVTDADSGIPLQNVEIQIYDTDDNVVAYAYADADGHYTASGLQPGSYYARTYTEGTAPNYANQLFEGISCPYWFSCDPRSGSPITAIANATIPDIDFALQKAGSISGRVTDSSGSPLGGILLSVYDSNGNEVFNNSGTSASGHYRVMSLAAGTYYIATRSDPPYLNEIFNDIACPTGNCNPLLGEPVTVAAGTETAGIHFVLAYGGSISGTVTDSVSGLPIVGLQMDVYDANGSWVGSTTSGDDGNYVLSGLSSCNYFVATNSFSSGLNYIDQVYDSIVCGPFSCEPTSGTPIPVIAGTGTLNINFILEPGGSFSGIISSAATGDAIYNERVDAYNADGSLAGYGYSDADGLFAIRGLPSGTYYAIKRHADADSYATEMYDNVYCDEDCDVTGGTPITVVQGSETPNINFPLDVGGRITGTVTDEAGHALTRVGLIAYDQAGHYAGYSETDHWGYYALDGLANGPHFLTTWAYDGAPRYINELYDNIPCLTCSPTAGTALPVNIGSTLSSVDLALTRGGTFSGMVTDAATKQGVSRVTIYVYDTAGNLIYHVRSDYSGHFTSFGLPTGQYHAVAVARFENDPLYLDQLYNQVTCHPFYNCDVTTGQPIDVTVGTDKPGISFTLNKGGRISGSITDELTGAGISPGTVDIYDEIGTWKGQASTNYAGEYTTDSLSAGTYYAVASAANYTSELYPDAPCDGCDPTTGYPISVTALATTPGVVFALNTSLGNRVPISNGEQYSATVNTTLTVSAPGVLINDVDPDMDPLTAVLDSNATNGAVTLHPDGSFSYSPRAHFTGTDNFTYHASDGTAAGAPVTVTITVSGEDICLFCDDFEDGQMQPNWTAVKPAWSETGGELVGTPTGRKAIAIANNTVFPGCVNCTIQSEVAMDGGAYARIWVLGWYSDKRNAVELMIDEETDRILLRQRAGGLIVAKRKASFPIDADVPVDVSVSFDGISFAVTVEGTELFTMRAAAPVQAGTVGFTAKNTTLHASQVSVFP